MSRNKDLENLNKEANTTDVLLQDKTKLEEMNQELRKRIKTERFFWIVLFLIIVDLFTFTHFQTWSPPVCITFLEILLLVPLGNLCEVESFTIFINRLLDISNEILHLKK